MQKLKLLLSLYKKLFVLIVLLDQEVDFSNHYQPTPGVTVNEYNV